MKRISILAGVVAVVGMVGCVAAQGETPMEKTQSSTAALIKSNPNPPYTFPSTKLLDTQDPFSCEHKLQWNGSIYASSSECDQEDGNRHGCQNYVAIPTTNAPDSTGATDPNVTAYTHSYAWPTVTCAAGDTSCQLVQQLQSDFFGIPQANGFKYLIARVTSWTCGSQCKFGKCEQGCVPNTTTSNWYLEGVQRVDESWWSKPWQYQASGTPAPWANLYTWMTDANSHPPYGTDYKSADWLQLWNVAYTYSKTGPNSAYTQKIDSEHHQCAAIFTTDYFGNAQLRDFFVAAEEHDPTSGDW